MTTKSKATDLMASAHIQTIANHEVLTIDWPQQSTQVTKQMESDAVTCLRAFVAGTQTYLDSFFSLTACEWLHEQIKRDWSTDLMADYQGAIEGAKQANLDWANAKEQNEQLGKLIEDQQKEIAALHEQLKATMLRDKEANFVLEQINDDQQKRITQLINAVDGATALATQAWLDRANVDPSALRDALDLG